MPASSATAKPVLPLDHRRTYGQAAINVAIHGGKNGLAAAQEIAAELADFQAMGLVRPDVLRNPSVRQVAAALNGGHMFSMHPNAMDHLLDFGIAVVTDEANAVLEGARHLRETEFGHILPDEVVTALQDAAQRRRAQPDASAKFVVDDVDVWSMASSTTAPPTANHLLFLERQAVACGAVSPRLVKAAGQGGELLHNQSLHSAIARSLDYPFPTKEVIQHPAVLDHAEAASDAVDGTHPDTWRERDLLNHFLLRRCVPDNGDGRQPGAIYKTHVDMLRAVSSLLKSPPIDRDRLWNLIRTFSRQTPWSDAKSDNFIAQTMEPALRLIANSDVTKDWSNTQILAMLHLLRGAEPTGDRDERGLDTLRKALEKRSSFQGVFTFVAQALSKEVRFDGWPKHAAA